MAHGPRNIFVPTPCTSPSVLSVFKDTRSSTTGPSFSVQHCFAYPFYISSVYPYARYPFSVRLFLLPLTTLVKTYPTGPFWMVLPLRSVSTLPSLPDSVHSYTSPFRGPSSLSDTFPGLHTNWVWEPLVGQTTSSDYRRSLSLVENSVLRLMSSYHSFGLSPTVRRRHRLVSALEGAQEGRVGIVVGGSTPPTSGGSPPALRVLLSSRTRSGLFGSVCVSPRHLKEFGVPTLRRTSDRYRRSGPVSGPNTDCTPDPGVRRLPGVGRFRDESTDQVVPPQPPITSLSGSDSPSPRLKFSETERSNVKGKNIKSDKVLQL